MYITEISLSDFRRMHLVGYRQKEVEVRPNLYVADVIPVDLLPDSEIEYAKSKGNALALFMTAGEEPVYHKDYLRMPANYFTLAGVEHIYSEKCRWLADGRSVSKATFPKAYLIHLED